MALGYKKTLEQLEGGERLMYTHRDPMKESDKSFYSLVPSGKTVHPVAVRKLREGNRLVAVPDGLFGADMSQTFCLREP